MTTISLADNIKSVKDETITTLKTYEETVNDMLDSINKRQGMFDVLTEKLNSINIDVKDFVCEYDEADKVIITARGLIKIMRLLLTFAKKDKLISGYKSYLYKFSETIDDFEEYIHDFKFRHKGDLDQSQWFHLRV